MKNILLTLVLFSVSACAEVDSFATKVKIPGGTTIETKGSNGSNGKFCPPGQAKKGNC